MNAPSEIPGTSAQTRWWIVSLLMALCFISHMNRVSMSIAADERVMAQYGISTVQMGWVYSAFLFVYTVFMIPGGMFIDRAGVRVALGLMALSTAAFGALTGLGGFIAAGQIWLWLIVVRSIMGLFTTPLHPASARAVGLWVPPSRQVLANGLVTGAAVLGMACTAPVFGALIDAVDWPRAFFVTAMVTAALGVVWIIATRRIRSPVSMESQPAQWGELFTSRSLILLTASYAALSYFQYLFFYWVHYYFEHILLLGKIESRNYAALPVFAMAVTMPLGGWLSQSMGARHGWRVGRVFVAGMGMLGAVIFLAAGVITTTPAFTVTFFTLALGSLGLSEAAFWQTALELGGARGASAAAVMNTGGNGIGLIAPVATPLIAKYLGWQKGIAVAAVVCLIGALCWLWIRPAQATNGALYESDRS
jgi:ACS family D-galactonate transporter-like MFS transporter